MATWLVGCLFYFLPVRSLDHFAHAGRRRAEPGFVRGPAGDYSPDALRHASCGCTSATPRGTIASCRDGFHVPCWPPRSSRSRRSFWSSSYFSGLGRFDLRRAGNVAERAGYGHAALGCRAHRSAHQLHNALGITSVLWPRSARSSVASLFFLIPRFSGGYLSALNLQPTLITGFSDDVELGEIGEIKKSSCVVMRVTSTAIPRAQPSALARHRPHKFRRQTLVHARTNRSTSRSRRMATANFASTGLPLPVAIQSAPLHGAAGAHRPRTRFRCATRLEVLRGHFTDESARAGVRLRTHLPSDRFHRLLFNPSHNYRARSLRRHFRCSPLIPPAAVREAGADYPDAIRDTYLQLPTLDPRIPELAETNHRARRTTTTTRRDH